MDETRPDDPETSTGRDLEDPINPCDLTRARDTQPATGESGWKTSLCEKAQDATLPSTSIEGDGISEELARGTIPGGKTGLALVAPLVPGYEILGEVGRGGMGVVFKARQLKLNRTVALKMLLSGDLAAPESTVRFLAEAKAAARLRHPNIVQIFHIDEHAGRLYFEMEFVPGGSLAQLIDGTPWAPLDAARMIEALARAIADAHRMGIIHRDLKPANVLLDDDKTPKIADFGLAKFLQADSGLTRTDMILGTPSYMAPEQAEGHARGVGPAADLYALGAILYELLTGRPPFRGPTVLQTLEQVKSAEPVPPSRLVPGMSRDIETICLRCLQKDPQRRYASAFALAEDLRRFQTGESILARPAGAPERLWRWCRRKPLVATLVGAIAVLLVAAAAGSGTAAWVIASKQAETVKARDEARANFARAEQRRAEVERQQRHTSALALRLTLDRARALGERHEIGEGLLWMARALAMAPPDDARLRRAIRASLASWDRRLTALRAIVPIGDVGGLGGQAFSGDGSKILVADRDGNARVLDSQTGRPIGPTLAHPAAVESVAMSREGNRLVTVDARHEVRVWDAATGALVGRQLSLRPPVFALTISPDGTRLAISGNDGKLQIRSVETGLPVSEPLPAPNVISLAFSPDGARVVSGGLEGMARVWDVASGQPVGQPFVTRGAVKAVAFSPDGRHVLSGGMNFAAQLWEVSTGKPVDPPLEHEGEVLAVAFNLDGRLMLTGSVDGTIRLWDVATRKPRGGPMRQPPRLTSVAFGAGGARLLATGSDHQIRIWDTMPDLRRGEPLRHDAPILSVAFSPDGSRIVTAALDLTARLWDAKTGRPIGEPMRHPVWVGVARFRPDGKQVFTGAWDGVVRAWDASTGRPVDRTLENVPSGNGNDPRWNNRRNGTAVIDLAFSPDGSKVILGLADWTARLWDPFQGRELLRPLVHDELVHSVAVRGDGQRLLTAGWDACVRQWDATSGQPVSRILRPGGVVDTAVFNPDGSRILTSTGDGVAQQWDAATGQPVGEPVFHEGDIRRSAYGPDGTLILTGSSDRMARFWDAATGLPIGPPVPHAGGVKAVAFSPDGSLFLTGDSLGHGQLWEAPPPPWDDDDETTLLRVQVSTGLQLDDRMRLSVLSPADWQVRRGRLGEKAEIATRR